MKSILAVIAILSAGAVASAATGGPDILIVMPDQMRGDCLSALGHPVVHTPNIDKLAAAGVLFRRGYSTVPSCIPARHALMTGMSPQASGVVGFHRRPVTVPTLPSALAAAGYATALAGRTMHQATRDEALGYQKAILGSTYVDNDDYAADLKRAAPQAGSPHNLVEKQLGLSFNHWQAKPWPLAEELHPTAWTVRQARKFLAATPAEKPLFLTASFYAPHPPLFPPKKYFDACREAKLPTPAGGDWVAWQSLPVNAMRGPGDRVRLEGEVLRAAQAGYFGLIDQIDELIAPLVAEFTARSQKAGRPWVIVFTTDHGEMLGDHGYFRKCEPYEGSANIPFIIAGSPEMGFKPGVRNERPVALEDIMPTLLELAHAGCPKTVDGVSLVAALRGAGPVPREVLHFEHSQCYSTEQAFQALTDGHIKYVWRPHDGREQLFDLDKDPREEHDLAKVAAAEETLKQWRGRLIARLAGRPEGFTDGGRLIPGRPYRGNIPPRARPSSLRNAS